MQNVLKRNFIPGIKEYKYNTLITNVKKFNTKK